MSTRTTLLFTLVVACLAACGGGKGETFAALDKHQAAYGRCGVMKESKTDIGGQPAWIAANVCEMKFKQTVLAELKDVDPKKFEENYDAWKKEKGEAAIAGQRGKPITPDAPAAAPGGGISEAQRIQILNDCNLVTCAKSTPAERATPEHLACMESCCRDKGMKQNCRE